MLIFDGMQSEPVATIPLDPQGNRTGDVWHAALSRDLSHKGYALRVEGPWAPEQGHRFDPRVLLIDPYAKALLGSAGWGAEDAASLVGREAPAH